MARERKQKDDKPTKGRGARRLDQPPSGSPRVQQPGPSGVEGSGAPPEGTCETWGAFTIGEGVGRPPKVPFQLAPRLYLVSNGSHQGNPAQNASGGPLADVLPCHLIFREPPPDAADRARQTWSSEPGSPWTWELVVERSNGAVHATLTASSLASSAHPPRLVWNNCDDWSPFGRNHLVAEPGDPGVPQLIVSAP